MRRISWVSIMAMLAALLSACGAAPVATAPVPQHDHTAAADGQPTEVIVFAAASLTEAFREVGVAFEAAHPGTHITFNFAGAPQLVQQMTQGAAVDVFASANTHSMDLVVQEGYIVSDTVRLFAHNRLVLVYPKHNPAGIQALSDLARPGVKLTIAAQEVPVGQYTLEFLDHASQSAMFGSVYKEAVLKNVVSYEQNVRAVLSKVTLGEADAGIVYRSDTTEVRDQVGVLDIPAPLNTIADYPIAAVKHAHNLERAQQFVDYVLSPEAQTILAKYGFISVTNSAGRLRQDQQSLTNRRATWRRGVSRNGYV